MKLPRVILADDHTLIAEALRHLIAPHYEVVATVADGRALLDSAASFKPDVIVADIAMPLLNGLEAGRQIKERMPGVKLIFLTMNEDPELAAEAMRSGASAYLLKKSAASELLHAIQTALRGKSYVTPQIARGIQESFIRNPRGRRPNKSLTPRQKEVVQLLAEGKSMKEAAAILRVAPRTVAFHKYGVMQDLGLKTNAELIHFAIRSRIVVGNPSSSELPLPEMCRAVSSSARGPAAAPARRGSGSCRPGTRM
jgi:DNA-binding NarL/FixJ family response regulator